MSFHISQRSVAALKAPVGKGRVWYDDQQPGFGVRITGAGVRAFILNYSIAGRERRYTIGRWPEWSADAARVEARKLRADIDKGIDPLASREAEREKERETERDEITMEKLAESYLEDHAVKKRAKSVYEDRRMLKNIILPKLGSRPIAEMRRLEVERLHNSLIETPYQANRVLSLIKKMFACAIDWDLCKENPAKKIKKFPEPKRETWLSAEQLQALSDALDEYEDQNAADALRLMIVTGARPQEVLEATWPMFDLRRGVWTKPSHHTKQKKTEHPPLNRAALAILKRMAESKTGLYLFPGREVPGDKTERPRTTVRNAWKQVCRKAGLATEYTVIGKRGKPLKRWKPTVRIYDLRHSFASHLVSRNQSLKLVGLLLGHTQSSTTDRYAHASDQGLRSVTDDFGEVLTLGK